LLGLFECYRRTGIGVVIGDRFELIRAAEKRADFGVDAGFLLGEPSKRSLKPAMALYDLAGTLEISACAAWSPARYAVRPAASARSTANIFSA
jgi:hypothetical protein